MKAIILSSGKGTRMMPLTKDMHKPMLEVNGEPLIAHKIKLLEDASINEIFINVAYKKDVITNYIKSLNKNIHLIDEGDEPLGTAAGIRNIVSQLKDQSFIVINSDVWTDYPLDQLKELDLNDNLAHIALIETPDYLAGDFDINGETITTGKKYVFSGIGKYHTGLFKKYNDKDLGDILRAEIAAGTALGMEAKKLMDNGDLVPDAVVIGMIKSKLEKNADAQGFIFDGFPRTSAQAEALDGLLKELGTAISGMIALQVDDEELTHRLLMRGKNSGRADDQNEGIIRNRIQEYNNKTLPLKEFYGAQGKLQEIEGIGSIESINQKLCAAIDSL